MIKMPIPTVYVQYYRFQAYHSTIVEQIFIPPFTVISKADFCYVDRLTVRPGMRRLRSMALLLL